MNLKVTFEYGFRTAIKYYKDDEIKPSKNDYTIIIGVLNQTCYEKLNHDLAQPFIEISKNSLININRIDFINIQEC